MQIIEITERSPQRIQQLLAVWESAVRLTHLFLSDQEIRKIRGFVPQAIQEVGHLAAAELEDGALAGFMGVNGQKLEMLFVSGAERGKGIGTALLRYGIQAYEVNTLAVNEQNPLAKGFYERMGFRVCGRSDLDEQGNPYPILYMAREGAALKGLRI